VRAAGRALAGFSSEVAAGEQTLKAFLYAHMYDAPDVRAVRREAQRVLGELFAAYLADPSLLPEGWRPRADDRQTVLRAIGDFVAGMTDRYAVRHHAELNAGTPPEALRALT
jgi:dGTPase